MTKKADIKSYSHDQILSLIDELGQPMFRAKQLEEWLFVKNSATFGEMSNLPASLREELEARFYIYEPELVLKKVSADGTRKYLLRLHDGNVIETVGIPSSYDESGDPAASRLTVCFSSQVGCPMKCSFCATGQAGFTRNLSSSEMFEQIRFVGDDFGRRVTNAVCMGQGEPFLNYEQLIYSLKRINSRTGLGIGARHITVSTCGLVDGIDAFSKEPEQYTLAISLHSAVQKTRDELMPMVRSTPLTILKQHVELYISATGRRPTFEYALIDGINDDDMHIGALIDFCRGMLCHVNIIPLNPIESGRLTASRRAQEVSKRLTAHGIENSVRRSRGADIGGACGQLKNSLD